MAILKKELVGIIILFLFMFSSSLSFADILYLKKGGKIEGEIIEETAEKIRMEVEFGVVTILQNQIKSIERKTWKPKEWEKPKFGAHNSISDVFEKFKEGVRTYNSNIIYNCISRASQARGDGNLTRTQAQNTYRLIKDNPYKIRKVSGNKAILEFKNSRNGQANPYIFTREEEGWKIDFVETWDRIWFGPDNKWYWRKPFE